MSFARLTVLALLVTLVAVPAVAQPEGRIGNLNDPVRAVPDLLMGDQSFAYLVFPSEQVSCPDGGCALQSVTMLVNFTDQQVPQTFSASAGLLGAQPDGAGGWLPGEAICLSAPMTFTVLEPGVHEITVPVEDVCDCVDANLPYFLNINFHGDALADLFIDDLPEPGVVFWDDGTGYTDMINVIVDKTSDGKVIIWGDIICCIVVATDTSTFGEVKNLFR